MHFARCSKIIKIENITVYNSHYFLDLQLLSLWKMAQGNPQYTSTASGAFLFGGNIFKFMYKKEIYATFGEW